MNENRPRLSTLLAQGGVRRGDPTGAISTPIYQSATFSHLEYGVSTGYDYSRTSNPTRRVVETLIAAAESGDGGFAFASGMAAVTAVLLLYRQGDHMVVCDDLYGGTYRVLEQNFRQFGLEATYVDFADLSAVEAAIIPGRSRAILLETPTNPLMKVSDIAAVAEIARSRGLHLIVDNTFCTPVLQRPLELGADIVIHSASKYLAGHNDVIAGVVVTASRELSERVGFVQNSTGSILGPQDSWLLLRGMKTLALRMEAQQRGALRLAHWLSEHPAVREVYYPGLPDHPGTEVHGRQASGGGGMLSFRVTDAAAVPSIINRLDLIIFAESLGGVETLLTHPVRQTHADIPPEVRERIGVTEDLLRLSVGIEAPEDLIADLENALPSA
ncbi:MAG: trans-sulfuration enzyme family protein [Alkalispirochaetaceae bacterium]